MPIGQTCDSEFCKVREESYWPIY